MTDTFERGGFTFTEGTVSAVVAHTWLYGNSARNSIDIVLALGLDPDMLLSDLQNAIYDWKEQQL
jgi:hypothetical protein